MNDNRPLGRCKIRGCPIRFTPPGTPDQLCGVHRDDDAYAAALSTHRSPWQDGPQHGEPPGKGKPT